jgi:hypothetical protein
VPPEVWILPSGRPHTAGLPAVVGGENPPQAQVGRDLASGARRWSVKPFLASTTIVVPTWAFANVGIGGSVRATASATTAACLPHTSYLHDAGAMPNLPGRGLTCCGSWMTC